MTDLELIKKALSAFREIAYSHRYGGLSKQYELAKQALEALERVEKARQEEQLRMF